MADIISSRETPQNQLMSDFKAVVDLINKQAKAKIISPMTITLGDEFQSVVKDLTAALEIIMSLEENIIAKELNFKLRYVLYEGEIETQINKKIAYEMLGSGLTNARATLTELKNSSDRFTVKLQQKTLSERINDAFTVYQGIVDDWSNKNYDIIASFLEYKDYKIVANNLRKDRSLMWRREKTTKIKEYLALKNIIHYLGECNNG